jgi:hypothetical protein
MLKKLIASASLLILAASPVLAQLSVDRSAVAARTAEADESEAEGSTGIVIGVVSAAAVIGGIIIASDDEDEPTSP